MVQKIFKYGTGHEIPEGAIYLNTVKNGEMPHDEHLIGGPREFVWHYFLIEVKE